VRFVTEGTIEERIVELQNKKNSIIAGAMGGASTGTLQESRTSDLRMLFT
jgi:SNF2 family DNA or RNA helicase